ncbi:MAG: cytochrome c family protein [Roseovarius sp.]
MKSTLLTACATLALALPAFADGHATGDAEAGEKVFKKCKSCHMIASEDETIVKGGKAGPNLYGIHDRAAGAEDFKYSKLMAAAGEKGLLWNEADFATYVVDPTEFLKEYTGESGRGKMQAQRLKGDDAINVWAYLVSVGPQPEG